MSTVLIGGVFDPLHAGHLAYIRAAGEYGRIVCSVTDSDKHVPLVPLADRYALLAALPGVAHVTDRCPEWAIREFRPRYYVKGEEWAGCLPQAELDACREVGTEIVYVSCRLNSSSLILQDYQRRVSAQAVREFEAIVHSQQPASQPWQPVTDYSLEGRRQAEGKHPQLIKDVFEPAWVLDVGCGPGHLMRMLMDLGIRCTGIDVTPQPDPPTIVIKGDIGRDDLKAGMADLVICREVLEHLTVRQVRQAVRNLVRLSVKYIYITTRFNDFPRHALDVQTSDNLDPTHITLLPKDTLRAWFVAEGCISRYDLELRMDWQQKGRCMVFEVPQ